MFNKVTNDLHNANVSISVFIFLGLSATLHLHYWSLLASRRVDSSTTLCQSSSLLSLCLNIGVAQEQALVLFSSLSTLTALGNSSSLLILNFICILTFQIISSPDLSPEVQTYISNSLLNISTWVSSRHLKINL